MILNINDIEEILGGSSDIKKREFYLYEASHIKATLFFIDGLVNEEVIDKTIISPLITKSYESILDKTRPALGVYLSERITKHLVSNPSIATVSKFKDGIDGLLSGQSLLLVDFCEEAFLISTPGWDARSVNEPQTEPVIRGPKDGFVEKLSTNTALVRRRIKDPFFRIESLQLGERSKTEIAIGYIEGIVRDGLVDEVKQRLQDIKIDAIIESGYVEELINDAPLSPFVTVQGTERPDKVSAEVYEGRVAIFVDNTPYVLIVPTHFWQFLNASDDYYSHYLIGSFYRILRYIAFVVSLTLPSIYVMLVSFHIEMLPTPLAITIAAGREAIPFPVLIEALAMEIAFELMREAGLRMPKPVGQAVSIVGSLIIGQAAVDAGLVSPIMVIVVATTGIASFAIPNYDASYSLRLLRFPLLIASGTMDLLGFAAIFVIIIIHALSLRSFGEPFMSPILPMYGTDMKDTMVRMPWWSKKNRPTTAKGDTKREGSNQKPAPPKSNSASKDSQKNNNSN
ncbi:spore germination protein [Bacillus tamaricis]|uniref:Spore germination protein n=2 Tax=Evansella tamaricis TaxID=2069301 RepID=A0ABS6JPT6_9BACI|nr:spore germination protein [Evansella tamaricis]